MLRVSQSVGSCRTTGRAGAVTGGGAPGRPCGGGGPKTSASRVPSHVGAGAWKRCAPTGGAADGMPRNTARPPSNRPRSAPDRVRTTGDVPGAGIGLLVVGALRVCRGQADKRNDAGRLLLVLAESRRLGDRPDQAGGVPGLSPRTTTTWSSAGSSAASRTAGEPWSTPRNCVAATGIAEPADARAKRSSCRIGISGLLTAPIRIAARWTTSASHQFGSCCDTTSPRPTRGDAAPQLTG